MTCLSTPRASVKEKAQQKKKRPNLVIECAAVSGAVLSKAADTWVTQRMQLLTINNMRQPTIKRRPPPDRLVVVGFKFSSSALFSQIPLPSLNNAPFVG